MHRGRVTAGVSVVALVTTLACAGAPQAQGPTTGRDPADTKGASPRQNGDSEQKLISEALALETQGRLEEAIDKHLEVLKLAPNEFRSMNSIAGLYGKLGRFDEELTWADRTLAANPSHAPAWVNRGNALGSLGRNPEAEEAFHSALKVDENLAAAYVGLGVLAEAARKLPEAAAFYQKAVQVDPRAEDAWFNLAAAQANLGQFHEAIASTERLLALNPRAEDAHAMLAQLRAQVGQGGAGERRASGCVKKETPMGPVFECAGFDLLLSTADKPVSLDVVASVLPASGLSVTRTELKILGAAQPAVRLERTRRDGSRLVGFATIVTANGKQQNVTCYLRHATDSADVCAAGLTQYSRGEL